MWTDEPILTDAVTATFAGPTTTTAAMRTINGLQRLIVKQPRDNEMDDGGCVVLDEAAMLALYNTLHARYA